MVDRECQATDEETPWPAIYQSQNNALPIYEHIDLSQFTSDGMKLDELKEYAKEQK